MIRDVKEIESLATKYSKQQLARMVQMGMLDPTKAVMAGMMRDRISKEDAKPPTTTVAQDVMGVPPPQMGMQAPQGQPQQAPQPQETQSGIASLPQEPQANAGIEALPAGEVGSYAGGGIVAFDDGGSVPGYAGNMGSAVNSELIELQVELGNLQNQLATNPTNTKLPGKIKDLTRLIDLKKERLGVTTPVQPIGVASLPAAADVNPDAQVAKMEQERADARKASKQITGQGLRTDTMLPVPTRTRGQDIASKQKEITSQAITEELAQIETDLQNTPPGPQQKYLENRRAYLTKKVAPVTSVVADNTIVPASELGSQSFTPAGTVPTFVSPVVPAAAGAAKKIAAPDFVSPVGISGSTIKRPDINIPSTKIPYKEQLAPEARGLAEISKEKREQLAAMGVDESLIPGMIAETSAKKEALKGRKGEAQGEALMQMGLGLMGARRGQEFQTLGESGIKALQTYKSDMKDLRSAEEKLDERRDALRVAENQAKRTGAEADIAKRDREVERFEASKAAAAKERNDLEKSEAVLRMQGAQIQTTAETARHATDVGADISRQQLKIQAAQAANTANYYNKSLALTENRMKNADAVTQARMIKLRQESDKMFPMSAEGMAIQKQLKGQYGDDFMNVPAAQAILQQNQNAFFARQLEGIGALIPADSGAGGIRDQSQL